MNLDKNIGWCTHTLNPTTGCLNKKLGICNVEACYAQQTAENPYYRKAFPYGFEPHFYPERCDQVGKLKTPAIIFMDSMSDTFGSWWTEAQIVFIINCAINNPHHKYIFLTKNPGRMYEILRAFKEKGLLGKMQHIYFGTSLTMCSDDLNEDGRIIELYKVHELGYKTVFSFEPLLHDPFAQLASYTFDWADWLIIGGQTKPAIIPPLGWVNEILKAMREDLPVFLKDNVGIPRDKSHPEKHWPEDLLPIARAWDKT